jgi:putative ABC transport system permease protein
MIAWFGTLLGLVYRHRLRLGGGAGPRAEGITNLVVPAAPLAVVAALAVATGVGAAVMPARRAARLDVLEALRS